METGTDETVFVYDAFGKLVAEYSTEVSQAPKTSYLTTDHLGSPRVITDQNGQVISRRDFMPFGEELGVGAGPRTENLKYSVIGSDNIRKRFTGYEKDDETGLDFAEARMYQSKHGRFTAPDPLLASANGANPQTFNRYAYTGNDPVNYSDPSGLQWCRNADGTVGFQKDTPCDSNQTDITDQTLIQSGDDGGVDSNGVPINRGDYTTFYANGKAINQTPAQYAASTGTEVQARQEDIPAANAEELSVGSTEIASTIATRGGDFAPCPSGALGCGTDEAPLFTLDTTNVASLKTVEAVATIAEYGSILPVVGTPFAIIAGVIRAGQGDAAGAGGNLLNAVPFFSWLRKADKAVDAAKAAEPVVEGIYQFVSSNGKVYVGQSSNIAARIKQHLASGKLLPDNLNTVTATPVLGGKTAREIAEQLRIRALGGIRKADGTKNLRNERNPIGKAREYLLKGL